MGVVLWVGLGVLARLLPVLPPSKSYVLAVTVADLINWASLALGIALLVVLIVNELYELVAAVVLLGIVGWVWHSNWQPPRPSKTAVVAAERHAAEIGAAETLTYFYSALAALAAETGPLRVNVPGASACELMTPEAQLELRQAFGPRHAIADATNPATACSLWVANAARHATFGSAIADPNGILPGVNFAVGDWPARYRTNSGVIIDLVRQQGGSWKIDRFEGRPFVSVVG